MAIYTVDVFSGSADSIIQDSHAQGVIVKATQGTGYVNPACNHQWDLAGSLGKLRGLYHYAGGGDPVAEAQYFLNAIRNYVGQGILAVDWESNQNSAWGNPNWVRGFVDEVHRQTGVWPIIYVQESALNQVANCANDCGLWVAKYASMDWGSWALPNMTPSSGAFSAITGWQYTGGDMDRSIFYLDAAGWNHLANPGQQTSTPSGPTDAGSASPPMEPPDFTNSPITKPADSGSYISGIVLQYGKDAETGVWGAGYSYDNGAHFYVTDTVYGRKYRQEDGDRVWHFISDKVKAALDGRVVTWSSVQGAPEFALKSDLPSLAGYAKLTDLPNLADYAKKSDLPSTEGLVKETELTDYTKKSDLPSMEGLAKETELADYAKKADIPQTLAWGQVTGKPSLATSADVDDLREQIAKAGQAGDAGLSIEAIAELVKSRVHAAIDPTSGHLAITVDDASSDTIAEAVAAKVAGSLSFVMNNNGDLIASVGR